MYRNWTLTKTLNLRFKQDDFPNMAKAWHTLIVWRSKYLVVTWDPSCGLEIWEQRTAVPLFSDLSLTFSRPWDQKANGNSKSFYGIILKLRVRSSNFILILLAISPPRYNELHWAVLQSQWNLDRWSSVDFVFWNSLLIKAEPKQSFPDSHLCLIPL